MTLWQELLSVAIHAPSPHNVQPWRVKIINDSAGELYIDSTRTLPKEDVTGSFIICAMGMFVEALSLLASAKGYQFRFELLSDADAIASAILHATSPTLIPFASLALEKLSLGVPDGDVYDKELFLKRRTSRLHLHEKAPLDESIAALRDVAKHRGQQFDVTTDPGQIDRLLELNTVAMFDDLNSPDYHDEIVEWFRYTEKQSLRHRDGLDARCMNTSPINYWIVAKFPQLLLVPLGHQLFRAIYRRRIGHVPAIGYISGSFWKPADSIESGRCLMRFWLEATRQGLYIHPYGNLVTNRSAAEMVESDLGTKDIWLIFKIGYSDEPPQSRRLALENILTS